MGTVFLFGAGASYGSDSQNTPPLGDRLFDELRRFNPGGWGAITGSLADQFQRDFEEAIKFIKPQALAPLQRAMAAYFFEFMPSNSSLYFKLAHQIARTKGWTGAVCTLNYERLLEISFKNAGLQLLTAQPAAGKAGVEICFPHGCCHFFCNSVKGSAGEVSFNGFRVQTDGPVIEIHDPNQHQLRIRQDAFPPVMSYFEPRKRTTAGCSFIQKQRGRWRELALGATTIVIVGLRVRPHDEHVWTTIAATSARIVYCGGRSGASEYRSWAATARSGRVDRILDGYFQDEFDSICGESGILMINSGNQGQ